MHNFGVNIVHIHFRDPRELRDENGKCLPKLQHFLSNLPATFLDHHAKILKNIQDCHNSLNSGRPKDALERVTETPQSTSTIGRADDKMEDHFIDMHDCFIQNIENELTQNVSFRSSNNKFSIKTSHITELGRHQCGTTLIRPPKVDTMSSVFLNTRTNAFDVQMKTSHKPFNKSDREKSQDREKLFELSQRCTEIWRSTDDENATQLHVTGTLENVGECAKLSFKNDEHQCKAFELIVAAFIVELYKAPKQLGKRQRQKENIVKELKNVNHEGQFVAFLSGPGGTGKSRVINAVLQHCKKLCENANMGFNKRTITVTALTGAVAASIFGETTHGACLLNSLHVSEDHIREWKDTNLLIVDEMSFASNKTLQKLSK